MRYTHSSADVDLKTARVEPKWLLSVLIEEVQVLGVGVQGGPQGGIVEDLAQLLGALGVEIPEVGVQSLRLGAPKHLF